MGSSEFNLPLGGPSCVHCGLCTSECPTYRLTGDENEGPRGRIHLLDAVAGGRLRASPAAAKHLDSCLDCRACETACPSGVRYGRMIESYRVHRPVSQRPLLRLLLRHVFPHRRRLRFALGLAAAAEGLGFGWAAEKLGLFSPLSGSVTQLRRLRPRLRRVESPRGDDRLKTGRPRPDAETVHLLRGCVAAVAGRDTHAATVALLSTAGYRVEMAGGQACCGAVAYHAGLHADALRCVRSNARSMRGDGAIVANVAGCGAFLKEVSDAVRSLPGVGEEDVVAAESLAGRTRDVHELLSDGRLPAFSPLPLRVAYQSACHLHHAQRCGSRPQELLRRVPALEVSEPVDALICCGAAGTYNLTHVETSRELGRRKVDALLASDPDVIATGNIGCRLQLEAELRDRGVAVPVVHPVQILAEAAGVADFGLAEAGRGVRGTRSEDPGSTSFPVETSRTRVQ